LKTMRRDCIHCGRQTVALGLCGAHYRRARLGRPMDVSLRLDDWSKADIEKLERHYAQPGVDLAKVAMSLGRTEAAVAIKASRLGLGDYSRPKRVQLALNYHSPPPIGSPERRAEQSRAAKKGLTKYGHPRGMAGKKHSAETIRVLSAASKRMWADKKSKIWSEENQQRRSNQMYERMKSGAMRRGYSRGKMGRRPDLGDQHFRSSWEANYARFLNWRVARGEVLSWEFEKHTFWFESIRRGVRSYLPDFKVTLPCGAHEWHEVKGWMDPKSATKLKRMAKYYPAETVVVIDHAWFRQAAATGLAALIPNWEKTR
jgi:hypothetical protein